MTDKKGYLILDISVWIVAFVVIGLVITANMMNVFSMLGDSADGLRFKTEFYNLDQAIMHDLENNGATVEIEADYFTVNGSKFQSKNGNIYRYANEKQYFLGKGTVSAELVILHDQDYLKVTRTKDNISNTKHYRLSICSGYGYDFQSIDSEIAKEFVKEIDKKK